MTAVTPDLISVTALDGYRLDLVFADGKRGVFDCTPYMQFEFMEDVREPSAFATVRVDHGTAAWPGGEDLCPDDLYFNMEVISKPPHHRTAAALSGSPLQAIRANAAAESSGSTGFEITSWKKCVEF